MRAARVRPGAAALWLNDLRLRSSNLFWAEIGERRCRDHPPVCVVVWSRPGLASDLLKGEVDDVHRRIPHSCVTDVATELDHVLLTVDWYALRSDGCQISLVHLIGGRRRTGCKTYTTKNDREYQHLHRHQLIFAPWRILVLTLALRDGPPIRPACERNSSLGATKVALPSSVAFFVRIPDHPAPQIGRIEADHTFLAQKPWSRVLAGGEPITHARPGCQPRLNTNGPTQKIDMPPNKVGAFARVIAKLRGTEVRHTVPSVGPAHVGSPVVEAIDIEILDAVRLARMIHAVQIVQRTALAQGNHEEAIPVGIGEMRVALEEFLLIRSCDGR